MKYMSTILICLDASNFLANIVRLISLYNAYNLDHSFHGEDYS